MFVFYRVAVSTARVPSIGTSLSDVIATARQRWIYRDWRVQCLYANPGVYQSNVMNKTLYRHRVYLA
jgi:hypothetical protein